MMCHLSHDYPSPAVARSLQVARRSAIAFGLLVAVCGCAGKYKRPVARSSSATVPATQPVREFHKFFAEIDPPTGWRYELTSESERHEHVTWISPSNNTACGALYFRMPFPVGHELAFRYGFLDEMKKKEGVANVIEKHFDEQKQCLRFSVESRFFHTEATFFVRGWEGWMFYAGTRLGNPVNESELAQARAVREKAEFVESK